jgi:hypothetical protein
MKLILAALCGLMILFMGGCAIVAAAAFPLPLIPGGIALLNVAMLAVMFGWKDLQWRWAFYVLGVIDILLAVAGFLIAAESFGSEGWVFHVASAAFLLKGILSILYVWRKPEGAT